MKLYQTLFWAGAATAALASCSAEEDYGGTGIPTDGQTIEVSTYIPGKRAIDKTTFVEGDKLGLYACRTTGGYANSFTANFMDNVEVTRGTVDWTYSPLMAWPTDANEHLSFIAFYPRSEESTATTYPFTVNSDFTQQTDPLWCTVKDASINDRNGTAINGSEEEAAFEATSGSLPLKFKHMLSKVNVKIKLAGDYPGITARLNSLTLNNVYSSGTFYVANDLTSGTWSNSGSRSFTIHSNEAEAVTLTSTEQTLAGMLMIPQDVSANRSSFTVTYTHTLAEGGEKTVTRDIFLPNSWAVNQAYNYVITLNLDVNTITVSAETTDFNAPVTPNIGYQAADAVDLGLSVKWASYDYGTVSPYDLGPVYSFSDNGSMRFSDTWGVKWGVPTQAKWQELLSNCEITTETENGIIIYRATAKNGNSIILRNDCYWTTTSTPSGDWVSPKYYYVDLASHGIKYFETYSAPAARYPIRLVFAE